MSDTPEVKQVTISIKPCSRALPSGQIAFGYYTVDNGVLTMTDSKGNPARDDAGKAYTHKMETNDNAHEIAGGLTKKLRDTLLGKGKKDAPPSGFSGPLNYGPSGIY